MQKPVPVSEKQAADIISNLNVERFNQVIPIPMREDHALRRLQIYRERLVQDSLKMDIDPTRTSAAFLLGRDQFHGASNAGAIIKLALLHNNVDSEIIREFDWDYANVDSYIGQRIGKFDPLNATPVMNQGHWQESVIRTRLECEKGYRFDPELLEALNNVTLPEYPDVRATNDAAGFRKDGVKGTSELKMIADPHYKYEHVADIHYMQVQVQSLLAESSRMGFQKFEIHYPQFSTGKIHTFDIKPDPEIQKLYLDGTKIANEYITAGHIPNLDRVQVQALPMTPKDRVAMNELVNVMEAATVVEKKAIERKQGAVSTLNEFLVSKGFGKDDISGKNLSIGTNRPVSTMKAYMKHTLDIPAVIEALHQHKLYDKALGMSQDMSEGHLASLSKLNELGVDSKDFAEVEVDMDRAIELLAEVGVSEASLTKKTLLCSSMNCQSNSENRIESKAYSAKLREVGDLMADTAIAQTMNKKPPVVVLEMANTADQEEAPTVDEVKAPTLKGPSNM